MDFEPRSCPAKQPLYRSFNASSIVFVTVCTKGRRPLLDNREVHELLYGIWAESREWVVGRYVLLPDHVHLFAAPRAMDCEPVRDWVKWWKAASTRTWPASVTKPIWQREAWDRQLRSDESYDEKWRYVTRNPVRHGLVERVEDWPYQGVIHPLAW